MSAMFTPQNFIFLLIFYTDSISVSCRGILKLGSSVYSVSCDSDQPLNYSLCLLDGQNVPCEHCYTILLFEISKTFRIKVWHRARIQ